MGEEKSTVATVQATESTPPTSLTANPAIHRERPTWLKVILLIIDIGLALSPLLFLGIAFAAIAYNHKRVDDDPVLSKNVTIAIKSVPYQFSRQYSYQTGGNAVINTANIAVSIFPILFAAVVGRFMKPYALHCAERGSTMGVLEQLYGSQNLSNSVQLLFALRGPGLLGVAVVLTWLLSPLGGQGVKRVLGTTLTPSTNHTNVYYCNTSSTNSLGLAFNLGDSMVEFPMMNDAFGSLLFTDSFSAERDIWGNMKVPYLSQDQANRSEWTNVSTDVVYSAMAGLLINNLPNDAVTSFNITTSYVDMTCRDALTFDYVYPGAFLIPDSDEDINLDNLTDLATKTIDLTTNMTGYQEFLDWAGTLLRYSNMTSTTNITDTTDTGNKKEGTAITWDDWQYFVDVRATRNFTDNTTRIAQPVEFVYVNQVLNTSSMRIYAYECAASIQWLEALVNCSADSSSPCSVTSTRAASQPASQYEHPLFSDYADAAPALHHPTLSWLLRFVNQIGNLQMLGMGVGAQQTAINKYLTGGGTYSSQNDGNDWSNVTGSDLSPRLGTILNTAWLIGVQEIYLAQPKVMNITQLQISDPTSPTYLYNDIMKYSVLDYVGYDVTAASAIRTTTYQMYQVNWTWVIIAIVISLLLLFLGLLGLYFRHTNNHPDVLGFVSTLTRDNPAFEPPPQAEKLDGMEMASYYKHTRVQLVNTANSDDQARITLRQVQRSSGGV